MFTIENFETTENFTTKKIALCVSLVFLGFFCLKNKPNIS